jgi:hypothetical protein
LIALCRPSRGTATGPGLAAGVRFLIVTLLLAGCTNGPFYWTRAGATPDAFNTDHAECVKGAAIGYGIGSEKTYKACMSQRGWTRIQGRGSQPPDVPHFRGIEGDDEFPVASPAKPR